MSELEKLLAVLRENLFPVAANKLDPEWPFQSGWNEHFKLVELTATKIKKGEI